MFSHCELMLEDVLLIQWVFPLHLVDRRPEVGGCNLRVSTSHRLQYDVMDECKLFLKTKQGNRRYSKLAQ